MWNKTVELNHEGEGSQNRWFVRWDLKWGESQYVSDAW